MERAKRHTPHGGGASKCGATNRQGQPCGNPAGFKTDHVGEGRCHLHGGASLIRSGRYSTVSRPRVRELVEGLTSDPDPLDLLPEVALVRAILQDFVERYDEALEALLAWNAAEAGDAADEGRAARPQRILPIGEAAALAERVARIVGVIQSRQREGSITLETFNRVMEQMGVSVARHVKDAEALRKIEREWLGIQVG